ncbi:hypothetical protein HMI56_001058 [Coelomomyces lativittatus]|nr:hypothetical protein HMI56_001058 [Coelomomyces lativittatus]
MNPDYYSHSMFSCAVQGKALAILERRSILWMAEPCTVLPETRSLFEAPLPRPPSPWKINLEDYLPKRLAMPYDVSIEVPDSSVYRMCFKCKGNGALEIDTETILCSTCLGLCSLRLSIRLTVYWLPKTIFHSDLNGYTIPERLLSMVDDADPNKYQTLTKYYKNKLLNLLSEIVPAGIRLKQCMFELRVIPLVEIIYCNKKKSKRFIVCGEQRKAAIVLDSKKK